jgi:NADH-quinone oxidoreductase subunit L
LRNNEIEGSLRRLLAWMALSFLLSFAFGTPSDREVERRPRRSSTFHGFGMAASGCWLSLDPLAVMLVGFPCRPYFIYNLGYMSHDENFTFFCFLSLFSAAMLGVVIANSLLLLFM